MTRVRLERHVLDGKMPARCEPCLQRDHQCRQSELPRRWGIVVDYCPYFTSLHVQPELVRLTRPAEGA